MAVAEPLNDSCSSDLTPERAAKRAAISETVPQATVCIDEDDPKKAKRWRGTGRAVAIVTSLLAIGGFLAILFFVILQKEPAPRSTYIPADPFQAIPKSIGTTKAGARIFEQDVKALNVDGFPLSYKYRVELAANVFSIEEFHQDHPTMRIQVHECEPASVLVEFDAAKADNYTFTFLSSSLRVDNVLVGGAHHKCATPSSAAEGFYRKIRSVEMVNSTVYETLEGQYEKIYYALETVFVPHESCFKSVKLNFNSLDVSTNYRVEPDAAGYAYLVKDNVQDSSLVLPRTEDIGVTANEDVAINNVVPNNRDRKAFHTTDTCNLATNCYGLSADCGWCTSTMTCISPSTMCERPLFDYKDVCPQYDQRLISLFEDGEIMATGYRDECKLSIHHQPDLFSFQNFGAHDV